MNIHNICIKVGDCFYKYLFQTIPVLWNTTPSIWRGLHLGSSKWLGTQLSLLVEVISYVYKKICNVYICIYIQKCMYIYWHKCICKYIYTMTPILERQNAIFLYQVQNTSGASDATFASWPQKKMMGSLEVISYQWQVPIASRLREVFRSCSCLQFKF